VTGRKRHLVVDTMGLLLAILVHPANVSDRDGAYATLARLVGRFPRLRHLWADAGYSGQMPELVAATWGWTVEIVRRVAGTTGFAVQPRRWVHRRWVVERTFGWFGRYRGLSKDYEQLPESSETMIRIAMLQVMLKRLEPAA